VCRAAPASARRPGRARRLSIDERHNGRRPTLVRTSVLYHSNHGHSTCHRRAAPPARASPPKIDAINAVDTAPACAPARRCHSQRSAPPAAGLAQATQAAERCRRHTEAAPDTPPR
jgi:hypothetical protein